ncbi:MAG: hypothetical protein AAB581_03305 [Patescibacteria group bacterium]
MSDTRQELYSCSVTGCGTTGPADRMYSLDKRATSGKRVVVCPPCGKLAWKEGIRTYKLSDTLRYEEQQAMKRGFFQPFTRSLAKAEARKDGNGKKPKLHAVG